MKPASLFAAAIAAALSIAPVASAPPDALPATVQTIDPASLAAAPRPHEGRQPRYPLDAYRQQVDGRVSVALTIGPHGRIVRIDQLAETPPRFGFFLAVSAALQTWRFDPGQAGVYRLDVAFDHRTAPPPTQPPANAASLPKAPDKLRGDWPVYPPAARVAKADGDVELVITIGPDLRVSEVALMSEKPAGYGFAERAMDAAQTMAFPPGTAPGQYRHTVSFSYSPHLPR